MEQLALDFAHRPTLGREDFWLTSANEQAVKMLDLFPKWTCHALIIYGAEGCGKTHLAHVFASKAGQGTPIVPATYLTKDNVPDLLAPSGSVALEDIETLTDEEALFHLYNFSKENGGFLLMTCDKAPQELGVKLPDLRSRLLSVPALKIANPDDKLLKALLVKLFSDRQLDISEETLEYAVVHIERTFKAAKDLVALADKESLAKHRAITIPLLRDIITQQSRAAELAATGDLFTN